MGTKAVLKDGNAVTGEPTPRTGESITDRPIDRPLDVDRLYDVLANQRRRFALYYLKRHPEGVSIGELTEQVAAWEVGATPAEVTPDQRKRVYTALQQSHLPALESASIVTYDEERRIVEPTEALASIECYPMSDRSDFDAWSRWYLGVTALSSAVVSLAWLGLWPISILSPLVIATGILVAFATLVVTHWYATEHRSSSTDARPPELDE
ncbi:DUF7344 domain-containing protein [Halovivax gelatinilyticus]|uniref:DUF7344 domain-containing protein n=1 Tax=Halovivax gelatinilyticus TaxID=2961597 RepID=UPI0020CA4E94|nr:hypothetical protein [Halovivax gelatinilyticus]